MIQHNYSFTLEGHRYSYDANAIQAYKDNVSISLREFTEAKNRSDIGIAFGALMGVNGDQYVIEILEHNMLSQKSYDAICANVKFNGKDSIVQYFGIVHYYYLQSIK